MIICFIKLISAVVYFPNLGSIFIGYIAIILFKIHYSYFFEGGVLGQTSCSSVNMLFLHCEPKETAIGGCWF